MQIEYVDFSEDIFSRAVRENPALYVCETEAAANLQLARGRYEEIRQPLTAQSQFIDFNELKERLFARESIVLREEKLSVVLFELLKPGEKQKLGIENYNDIIEFSARFHRFYRELNEYRVEEITGLEGWQQDRYELVEELHQRYCERLEREGYTSPALSRSPAHYSPETAADFEYIVFINPLDLTPLEKDLMQRLDRDFSVEIYLQMPEDDYSLANLEFQGLTLPESWPGELNIYRAEEGTMQLASALMMAEPGMSTLFSPRLEDTDYARMLSSGLVKMDRCQKFSRSRIYRFLELTYKLMAASPLARGELALPELFQALSREFFRSYFSLSPDILEDCRRLLRDNYLYLDREMAAERMPSLEGIFAEVEHLHGLEEMPELVEYLDGLDLDCLSSPQFWNDVEQFYDALLELRALEDMELVSSWASYYKNPALGLLDRFLQYIEFKKIEPLTGEKEAGLELEELFAAPHIPRRHVLVLNASQNWLPAPRGRDFLLTEPQRRRLGLPTAEDERKKQRYYFMRHLLTCGRADVLAVEDSEANISPGAFLEELRFKYDLSWGNLPLGRSDYDRFYTSVFSAGSETADEGMIFSSGPDDIEDESPPRLEAGDFPRPGGYFGLGYYKYRRLEDCYYRFFLEQLMQLPDTIEEIRAPLKPITFGSMVHRMAERILQDMSVEDIEVARDDIEKAVDDVLEEFQLKIDHRFQEYYSIVIREDLVESLWEFFTGPDSPWPDSCEELEDLRIEHTPDHRDVLPFLKSELADFYLSGRIDLLLSNEDNDVIIDFKSGGGRGDQLNFYALLLEGRRDDTAEPGREKGPPAKYIYQIMERKFLHEPRGTEAEFAVDIESALREFVELERYEREYQSRCKNCPYKKICRVVSEL